MEVEDDGALAATIAFDEDDGFVLELAHEWVRRVARRWLQPDDEEPSVQGERRRAIRKGEVRGRIVRGARRPEARQKGERALEVRVLARGGEEALDLTVRCRCAGDHERLARLGRGGVEEVGKEASRGARRPTQRRHRGPGVDDEDAADEEEDTHQTRPAGGHAEPHVRQDGPPGDRRSI